MGSEAEVIVIAFANQQNNVPLTKENSPHPSRPSRTQVFLQKYGTYYSVTFDYSIHDPSLTSLGESQARAVGQTYPSLLTSNALLVSSPLRRTIQTALLAFHRNPLLHPGFQENSSKPCDTGSPASALKKEFPELDFTLVVDGWDSKQGEWAPDEASLARRAAKMRKWLKEREENEIIVVTHGGTFYEILELTYVGFLLCLVEEIKGFENGECRSYTFADCEEAILIPYPQGTEERKEINGV